MPGTLYIVATPIGNLGDVTNRALETLRTVSLILCEDTRVTKKLLSHFEIKTPVMAFHQHSGEKRVQEIIARLKAGETMALVSDAGTPGVNDPGGKLIEAIIQMAQEVDITPIPGPAALMAALSISGFAADAFVFLGFVPHKKGRETWFAGLTGEKRVVVFYESVHRIKKALASVNQVAPERRLVAGRELTKKFETIYRGTASDVLEQLSDDQIKGEFVIVLDRA